MGMDTRRGMQSKGGREIAYVRKTGGLDEDVVDAWNRMKDRAVDSGVVEVTLWEDLGWN